MAEVTKKSLLIVEGKTESSVLPHICHKCGIETNFDIKSENSLPELKKALQSYLKSTNIYRKVWIIIDADNNADNAWTSIKSILIKSGKYSFDQKMELQPGGAIINAIDPEDITVGVWIMPNNADVGMLEDFMLRLIPADDILLQKANDIVEELDADRHIYPNLFRPTHKSKARIHTWLSWHHKPGESLSVAVSKHLFDTDGSLCRRFASWLDNLNS